MFVHGSASLQQSPSLTCLLINHIAKGWYCETNYLWQLKFNLDNLEEKYPILTIPLLVVVKTICKRTSTLTHTAETLIQLIQMKNKQIGIFWLSHKDFLWNSEIHL